MRRYDRRTCLPWAASVAIRAVLASVALCLIGGCAILDPPPPRHGGSSLSDAAREAKKKEEDKHERLTAGRPVEEPPSVVVEVEACDEDEPDRPAIEDRPERPPDRPKSRRRDQSLHLGLVTGGATVGGRTFDPSGFAGIQFGCSATPRTRLDLTLLGLPTRWSPASGLAPSFRDPFEIAADLSFRYSLTPEHTFVGVYPIAGLRLGTMFWDYANPLVVEDGGQTRTVRDDRLNYYAPYAGVGTSLIQTRHFQLGANLTGGIRLYDRHSYAGFRNDRFPSAGFVQLMLETAIRF